MRKILLMMLLFFNSCSDFNKEVGIKDDNPLEEALEDLIKNETGLDFDFTPEEKND